MAAFKAFAFTTLLSALTLGIIAIAPDVKGIGDSEVAFAWRDSDQRLLSVTYTLSGEYIVIAGPEFTLVNPSPQRQFLRVPIPEGEYRVRHRMPIAVGERTGFEVETVSLPDSTVSAVFHCSTY